MKRILLFCERDWMNPRADAAEAYTHQVFSRIASEGRHIIWVCNRRLAWPFQGDRPRQVETADGIQIARLGAPLLFRWMARTFLAQLAANAALEPFDVIIECVTSRPIGLHPHTPLPCVPLVFNISKRVAPADLAGGPVFAATETAYSQLRAAGVPQETIIRAPGAGQHWSDRLPSAPSSSDDEDRSWSWDETARLFLATIENMAFARRQHEADSPRPAAPTPCNTPE